jgi:hypothetical protein
VPDVVRLSGAEPNARRPRPALAGVDVIVPNRNVVDVGRLGTDEDSVAAGAGRHDHVFLHRNIVAGEQLDAVPGARQTQVARDHGATHLTLVHLAERNYGFGPGVLVDEEVSRNQ